MSAKAEDGKRQEASTWRSRLTSTPRSVMTLLCTVRTTSSSMSAMDCGTTHSACLSFDSWNSTAIVNVVHGSPS